MSWVDQNERATASARTTASQAPETPCVSDRSQNRDGKGRTKGGWTVPNQLEEQFHQAMIEIHRRAKVEADYNATRFIGMVADRGGLATARYLLHSPKVSEGYAALWERGRL